MFAGSKAIVTGASRGIGLALSHRLADLGCSVTMVARNGSLLEDEVKNLPTPSNQHHSTVEFDLLELVNNEKGSSSGEMLEALSDCTHLINCAGVAHNKLFMKVSHAEMLSTFHTNLVAPMLLSQMAINPLMSFLKKSGLKPSILNIGSMLSISGVTIPGTAPYAALKAGLLGFTQSLAAELNGKIRINAVLPALVPETDMGKTGSKKLPQVPMEKVLDVCEEMIIDDVYNGQFAVADGNGFRMLGEGNPIGK